MLDLLCEARITPAPCLYVILEVPVGLQSTGERREWDLPSDALIASHALPLGLGLKG